MYIFKADAAERISLSGIPQARVAQAAEIDRRNLNKLINDRLRVRLTTAARIARAFADLTHISQQEALTQLFEEYLPQDDASP